MWAMINLLISIRAEMFLFFVMLEKHTDVSLPRASPDTENAIVISLSSLYFSSSFKE
jgi:hypothetical protein